jgi:hypothetical protein
MILSAQLERIRGHRIAQLLFIVYSYQAQKAFYVKKFKWHRFLGIPWLQFGGVFTRESIECNWETSYELPQLRATPVTYDKSYLT